MVTFLSENYENWITVPNKLFIWLVKVRKDEDAKQSDSSSTLKRRLEHQIRLTHAKNKANISFHTCFHSFPPLKLPFEVLHSCLHLFCPLYLPPSHPSIHPPSSPAYPWSGCGGSSSSREPQKFLSLATSTSSDWGIPRCSQASEEI